MCGRSATAATNEVEPTFTGILAQNICDFLRCPVVFAKGIRQTSVEVGVGIHWRDTRKLFHVGTQLSRSHAAVQAHADERSVCDRVPQRFERLSGKGAAAGIEDRTGSNHRHALAAFIEIFLNGKKLRFEHQRVDRGFGQQDIGTAVNETAHLFFEDFNHAIEGQFSQSRIIDIKRNRQRFSGRAHCARYEAGLFGGADGIDRAPRHLRRGHVHLINELFQSIIALRYEVDVERIGFDDVGTGFEVGSVNFFNDVRLGENQQIIVALERHRVRRKTLTAKIFFGEFIALNHRSHRAVKDQNSFAQKRVELRKNIHD